LKFINNTEDCWQGYPKLKHLHKLKQQQVANHNTKPYGVRVDLDKIVSTLNKWIENDIKFDVIMIGALVENQLIMPILTNLPINRLCSRPGFLYIWATTHKISQIIKLLNCNNFNKKFRRSEEMIFLPINENSPYFPTDSFNDDSVLHRQQWHCWMCITGTVRRSTDAHLIHCNVDTDLQIESPVAVNRKNVVPDAMYRVVENFSNLSRRLHIIPSHIGFNCLLKLRPGWVIMGPDVMIDNFNQEEYEKELFEKSLINYKLANSGNSIQYLVPQTDEIEQLRPKSPVIKQDR